MRNKLLIFITSCMLALSIFIINVSAATVDIASASDWNNLASQSSVNGNYRLTSDITVSSTIKQFQGTFDGGGHKITFSDSGTYCAPFKEITGTATISNLKTEASNTQIGTYFGGIVASTYSASKARLTITGCTFTSSYNCTGNSCAGGIIGSSKMQVEIKDCDVTINSSKGLYGTFVGGVLGSSTSISYTSGCSVSIYKIGGLNPNIGEGKSTGAIAVGGIVGSTDYSSSAIYKNKTEITYMDMYYNANGAVSNRGAGFLAGYFIGSAAANLAYVKNISSMTGRTAYLVGTSNSSAQIFNNVSETNSTSITNLFYASAPETNNSNYTVNGLSALQTTSTSYINPADCSDGSSIDHMEFKGNLRLLLNFAINIGCGDLFYMGSGERYFNSSLNLYKSTSSTIHNEYQKFQLNMYLDENRYQSYKVLYTIQGTTITLADFGTPAKDHYTFRKWKNYSGSDITTFTIPTSGTYTLIYGSWNAETKRIYFDVDGVEYKSKTATYNSDFNLPSTSTSIDIVNPTKKNYEFVRWEYKNGNKTYTLTYDSGLNSTKMNELFNISGNIRFNAVFNKVSEDISLNLNGGSLSQSFTPALNINQSLALPSAKPSKSGYTFLNYTISNGTKSLNLSNGGILSDDDVNEFIEEGKNVTITANYNVNVLNINYYNKDYYSANINTTIEYGQEYQLPEYSYTKYDQYFDCYEFTYNNVTYKLNQNDNLPSEVINGLTEDSSNTLNIYIRWKNIIHYDNENTFTSLDMPNITFDNEAEIVDVDKKYNGNIYTSGVRINDGNSFEYESDGFKDTYILTNEDEAILIINGEEYQAVNGIINAKLNNGTNDIKAKGNVTILNISYNEMAVSVDLKCQYDTLNHSQATKIRFIAIIDSVVEVEELDKGSFFITVNGIEKEFKITKIYRSLNSIDSEYGSKVGRFYAVYTIEGIEDAILANTVVEGANFKLSTLEGNNYMCSHDSFVLGE